MFLYNVPELQTLFAPCNSEAWIFYLTLDFGLYYLKPSLYNCFGAHLTSKHPLTLPAISTHKSETDKCFTFKH